MLKAAENAKLVFQLLMTFGNKFRRSLDHIGRHPVAEGGIGHYSSINCAAWQQNQVTGKEDHHICLWLYNIRII